MYVKFNNTRKQFYIAFCRYCIIHMWCDKRILTLIEISSWSWNQDAAFFDDGVFAMRERGPERQVFGSPIFLFRYNVRGYTHLNRPSYVGHHYSCLNVHISGLLHTKVRTLFIYFWTFNALTNHNYITCILFHLNSERSWLTKLKLSYLVHDESHDFPGK